LILKDNTLARIALVHSDPNADNILINNGVLSGLIDWEVLFYYLCYVVRFSDTYGKSSEASHCQHIWLHAILHFSDQMAFGILASRPGTRKCIVILGSGPRQSRTPNTFARSSETCADLNLWIISVYH
jgi:hypothetical protein